MPKPAPFKIEWEAREYEHKERSADWYWAVWIIAVSIAVVSVIFSNIIFATLVIVGTFALTLFVARPPENLPISIDERGVRRGRVLYPYETLASFWIDLDHPHKKIFFRSRKSLMPLIVVPIGEDADPDRLERLLSRHLKIEYHVLPPIERFLERLGF